ncbi:hypothetical protein DWZ10_05025 [Segatella copri]|uniref:Uncharacterized protein n=1 Tax=Segatella copri TaxID=165179 RepID=A0AA92THM3_9BACT|nr:hypothetical protein DXB80_05290 [Segatella copri]RGQ11275.1 hypothetical protein DWZ10_05025 [Segatella copri]
MEKPYALLQVHILFSFHTLIYIISLNRCKYTEFSRKIEENTWKIEENARKIGEFPRNPFLEVAEPKGDPAVVFGRFRSFLVIFRLIPIDSD